MVHIKKNIGKKHTHVFKLKSQRMQVCEILKSVCNPEEAPFLLPKLLIQSAVEKMKK
jgi:hypothetical protein